jgi:ferredoxin
MFSVKSECECNFFKLNFTPQKRIVENDFSGFLVNGKKIRGSCANCSDKRCLEYKVEELNTKHFSDFPKNTSLRVCPVNAIILEKSKARVLENKCIRCGLCVHRCNFSAIQFDAEKNKCWINSDNESLTTCSKEEQILFEQKIKKLPASIDIKKISNGFSCNYLSSIDRNSKFFADLSEIIVRNTLVNLGLPCNVNVHGNNHIRTEFFSEINQDKVLIGESNSSESDTLAVSRRILDDMAVLIDRYHYRGEQIIPLAVLNGLPNKRTDFYEVLDDIYNVLNVKIYTMTYHILFLLNLFNVKLNEEIISSFYISSKENGTLLIGLKKHIPGIEKIDASANSNNFCPIK